MKYIYYKEDWAPGGPSYCTTVMKLQSMEHNSKTFESV